MVTIATFNEPAKARQIKRRFEDAGIKTDIHNEAPLQEFGFMSRPQANAKVMVDDDDFEKAQSLMIEWESTDPDISAACSCWRSLRAQNYPERVLLSGLPLYLDEPGRAYNWAALASVLSGRR